MEIRVVEVTEFISEVRCDLRGHLEAVAASEATTMAVRGNMHIDTNELKVAGFKYEVRIRPLRLFGGH